MKVIDRHEFFTQRVYLKLAKPQASRRLNLDFTYAAKQLADGAPVRQVTLFTGVFVRYQDVVINGHDVEVTFTQLYNRLTPINAMVWFGDDEPYHSFSFLLSSRELVSADDSNHTMTQVSYPQVEGPPQSTYQTYVFYTEDDVVFRLVFRVLPISVNAICYRINERWAAREEGDYEKADKIRCQLKALGVLLTDEPQGTVWERA